jgi:hypothetical protein
VRTLGARDVNKRKRRSDRNKRRKKYAGRLVKKKRKKHGRFVPYETRRRRGDPILIWWWERKKMSNEGYRRWNRFIRPYIRTTVTKFVDRPFLISPEEISDKEKLCALAIDRIQYPGHFLLMMPTHSKNSFRVSFKKKAIIKIWERNDELEAKVFEASALSRYWFWKGI